MNASVRAASRTDAWGGRTGWRGKDKEDGEATTREERMRGHDMRVLGVLWHRLTIGNILYRGLYPSVRPDVTDPGTTMGLLLIPVTLFRQS